MRVFQIWQSDDSHDAVLDPSRDLAISYGELRDRIDACAAGLAGAGVEPGDRVAISSWSGVEATIGFLGILRAGATALPVNPKLTAAELVRQLPSLSPKHALLHDASGPASACVTLGVPITSLDATDDWARPGPRTLPETREDAIALILQTSGTTGGPKSVPLSQGNLAASTDTIIATYALQPTDTAYGLMPLFHVHGLIGVALSTLASGGTLVVPERPRMSSFWDTVAKHDVTWVSAVPTLLASIPTANRSPCGLRFLRSASSPLPPTLSQRLEDETGIPVLEAYGMTEATHQMASNPLPPGGRRFGTVGLATGTQIAIVDATWKPIPATTVGEVVVRGPAVTGGYLDNPEANATSFNDGWFRTGDLGQLALDGYLTLVGRVKEMINRGGEKISPREVDEALLTHPGVLEAAAYGVPDSKYGEVVHAVVVTRGDLNAKMLIEHCGGQLAGFKIPRTIHVVNAIPKGPTGKVQRNLLATELDGA